MKAQTRERAPRHLVCQNILVKTSANFDIDVFALGRRTQVVRSTAAILQLPCAGKGKEEREVTFTYAGLFFKHAWKCHRDIPVLLILSPR